MFRIAQIFIRFSMQFQRILNSIHCCSLDFFDKVTNKINDLIIRVQINAKRFSRILFFSEKKWENFLISVLFSSYKWSNWFQWTSIYARPFPACSEVEWLRWYIEWKMIFIDWIIKHMKRLCVCVLCSQFMCPFKRSAYTNTSTQPPHSAHISLEFLNVSEMYR